MPKRKRLAPTRKIVVGFGWYDRAQWLRLTEVVADRAELDDTYEQWQRSANNAMSMLEGQGHKPQKVIVQVDALVSWCKERGLPIDGQSRAEYVTFMLRERDGSTEVY